MTTLAKLKSQTLTATGIATFDATTESDVDWTPVLEYLFDDECEPQLVTTGDYAYEAQPMLEKLLEVSRLNKFSRITVYLVPGEVPYVLTVDGNTMPTGESLQLQLEEGKFYRIFASVYQKPCTYNPTQVVADDDDTPFW